MSSNNPINTSIVGTITPTPTTPPRQSYHNVQAVTQSQRSNEISSQTSNETPPDEDDDLARFFHNEDFSVKSSVAMSPSVPLRPTPVHSSPHFTARPLSWQRSRMDGGKSILYTALMSGESMPAFATPLVQHNIFNLRSP